MNEQDKAAMGEVLRDPQKSQNERQRMADRIVNIGVEIGFTAAIEYRDSLTCEFDRVTKKQACGYPVRYLYTYCPNCGRRVEVTK